ncbi:hypothetical protein M0813_11751 [Anaeramoeba flamelloides]|uniref:DUF4291 domain-containing protein n=1 Tax=Anaeramoeba flamelloides TaxID=1746091 RepID=A0ABQ8ZDX3_9EUKA|nr:hypothetical protein M0813_11751 [Anaeramoeba flamelloides]
MTETVNCPTFKGQFDQEGVYVYQAFSDEIADYAVDNQKFGGKAYKTNRMTWIKPSFAWVLYRSGYGRKHSQNRILKIKISHETLAYLLSKCKCKDGGSGILGRVQWDPARDLFSPEPKSNEPRKILKERAIQIGIAGKLSLYYNKNIISITDVTELSHQVHIAHLLLKKGKKKRKLLRKYNVKKDQSNCLSMESLLQFLPTEKAYIPKCSEDVLKELGMLSGETSKMINSLGKGKIRK